MGRAAVDAQGRERAAGFVEKQRDVSQPSAEPDWDVEVALVEVVNADRHGSAKAAYKIGEYWARRGMLDDAARAWRRADERGSADGSYALGASLLLARDPSAEAVLSRADSRGSPDAALVLSRIAAQRGQADTAAAAFQRAKSRAEAAARSGSVEATTLLGDVLTQEGALEAAEKAYGRADARGSARAAYQLARLLLARGELSGAEAALRRASGRDWVQAKFALASLLAQHDRVEEAKAVWRDARDQAKRIRQPRLAAKATEQLRAHGQSWLWERRWPIVVGVTTASAFLMLGWSAGLACLLAALSAVLWRQAARVGRPLNLEAGEDTEGAGGVSFGVGDLGAWMTHRPRLSLATSRRKVPLVRTFTKRDQRFMRLLAMQVGAAAGMAFAHSLGAFDMNVMVRTAIAWLGLSSWWYATWRWPDFPRLAQFAREGAPLFYDEAEDEVVQVGVTRRLSTYFRTGFIIERSDPLVGESRAAVPAPSAGIPNAFRPLERAGPYMPGVKALVAGGALLAIAIAPNTRDALTSALDIVAATMGALALIWAVGNCLRQVFVAFRDRDPHALIRAATYLAIWTVLTAAAYLIGLLDTWTAVARWVAQQSGL